MRRRLRASLTFANVTALAALVFAMAGGAYALSIPDSSGVLHGCVSKRTGALRVVAGSTSCHRPKRSHGRVTDRGEFAIAWNQQGARGLQGAQGQPGVVDTSQFYSKTDSDTRFQRAGLITYGNANNALDGQVVVSWPQLGFEIVTAGPTSVGNIALNVKNIGTQNINGEAMIHNGTPNNTISAFAFGLTPGQTTATAFSTAGPFVDFSVVTSSTDPAYAANVRCLNVTSGGVTRAHCWLMRSG